MTDGKRIIRGWGQARVSQYENKSTSRLYIAKIRCFNPQVLTASVYVADFFRPVPQYAQPPSHFHLPFLPRSVSPSRLSEDAAAVPDKIPAVVCRYKECRTIKVEIKIGIRLYIRFVNIGFTNKYFYPSDIEDITVLKDASATAIVPGTSDQKDDSAGERAPPFRPKRRKENLMRSETHEPCTALG